MELTANDFNDLRRYIYELCGLHIPDTKEYLITQRLGSLLAATGAESWREFYEFLLRDGTSKLRNDIISAITTNETSFFRDQHPFESFREHILPELCKTVIKRQLRGDKRPVRIWSAAASTGQEPLTLAMIIREHLERNPGNGLRAEDFSILATDISARALARAITGEYSEFELSRGLPENFRKYFTPRAGRFKAAPELQQMVEFRQFNLLADYSDLGSFETVFCRNVLIYFDQETKRTIVTRFRDVLRPRGHLVLGSTESVYGLSDDFEQLRLGKAILYRLRQAEPALG
ncbi:chemotaxis protein methyltransferase CheR [Paucidesulfovibrio gracilis DSM 16080]|uniref:protein-glutamate O-methyltransferase n=1 Tax=Paucidesulfovibrio gracilis DSM 16080 TaxID=1121449 RepID=A0A1T4XJ47_9BACT|nr:protein-glutamate O-methyltransferase CheR [Paucidesulfovibrio gracilis]SKA89506.1 chemotaxis protein methyltransferase CheR [Paucidesulfovibrio gracilis DSM 16080]